MYLVMIDSAVMEATFFLWSAVVGSQTLSFCIEYMFHNPYIHKIVENNKKNKNESNKHKCLDCFFNILSSLTAKELYFLDSNWFLPIVLFFYGLQISWVNPSVLFIDGISVGSLTFVYYLRFKILKPKVGS